MNNQPSANEGLDDNLSPPGTSETLDRAGTISDAMSSSFSQQKARKKNKSKMGDNSSDHDGDGENAGKMLDSDGFEIARMEAEDYEYLTLEEKILCGYYSAKPSLREAYPIAQMNMPKLLKQ